jgi:hypothetical protein
MNEMNDIVDLAVDCGAKELLLRAVLQLVRQFFEQAGSSAPQPLNMLELIGARTGAAGITDFLFAGDDFEHLARKLAASAPQVDLEGQGVAPDQWPMETGPPSLTLRSVSASGTAASEISISTQNASM